MPHRSTDFISPRNYQATPLQKLGRKIMKEPLIPIGCTLTVMALVNAIRAVKKGDHHQAQRMFRARVLAQGFTVMAMVGGGIYLADDRKKEREGWALERHQKQQAQNERWIKELEARDAEEKALRERIARRKELRKAGVSEDEAEAELEAQLAAVKAREAQAAAGAANSGGGVLGALGGFFGGGKKNETNDTAAAAAAATPSEAEAESEKPKRSDIPETKLGSRKSHGRSQLDTLGDLFGKRGTGSDGEEKK